MAYEEKSAIAEVWNRGDFKEVLKAEHAAINRRRTRVGHKDSVRIVPLESDDKQGQIGKAAGATAKGQKANIPFQVYDTVGLALSGGGVRSAAFCLGVIQALDIAPGFGRIDYLSTVSGGGYIGSSLTATMAKAGSATDKSVFSCGEDYSDSEVVGHLRNYSNYLLPRGEKGSFLRALGVLLRGWMANLALVLMVSLGVAIVMFLIYPERSALPKGGLLFRLFGIELWPFALALFLAAIGLVFYLGWAMRRSFGSARGADVSGPAVIFAGKFNLIFLVAVFLSLQPVAVAWLFWLHESKINLYDWLKDAVVALSPVGAAVGFFGNRISTFLKGSRHAQDTKTTVSRIAAQALVWVASFILPLLIWLLMLYICAGAIADGGAHVRYPLSPIAPDGVVMLPGWPVSIQHFYIGVFAILFVVTMTFTPNANSLHRLYRDRLSKAFLFDPAAKAPGGDFEGLDGFKLHNLSPETGGPYHLINAAVNLQGSRLANKRGRNADFFHFSSDFVGSDCTGYADTKTMEDLDGGCLDLATAVAVSGAAVSSNMGSNSIKPLAPTLALLNIRLGYWMRNPKFVNEASGKAIRMKRWFKDKLKYYLLQEMLGRLDEGQESIYLTDGGHLENLGLYQLLKRGCRAIIVVDAEADPAMVFPSYITLQRYARIDLGVRIDLPWMDIAAASLAVTKAARKEKPLPNKPGPHCALGHIHYPNGVTGYLLYIKSSLTGDENDQAIDYKKRNPSFPHETTGDQFFTEEQFEVYRALGFHAANGFFSGTQEFAWLQGPGAETQSKALAAFKALL